jgi:hypothetical protein
MSLIAGRSAGVARRMVGDMAGLLAGILLHRRPQEGAGFGERDAGRLICALLKRASTTLCLQSRRIVILEGCRKYLERR